MEEKNGIWINPLCEKIDIDGKGPFVKIKEDVIMTVESKGVKVSNDDGKTWSNPIFICEGISDKEPASKYLLLTKKGTLILLYLNFKTYKFSWDEENKEPKEECKLELWAIRSLDMGKTWMDNQMILDGYNANFFSFFQTDSGRIVATVEHLIKNPGRWVSLSIYSDDEGKTWKKSNFIDIGGHGHHDGATEPTCAQLNDGRLLMLIRTNLDRFWEAYSVDEGRYWRIIKPSEIDASSSPGYLLKLQSGRLILVWNRLNPEGEIYPKEHYFQATEFPASWHREELSVSFSEDDGKTWTKPVVIGKKKDGQISYPYIFERRRGEIWIIAGFSFKKRWEIPFSFKVKINEEEFLKNFKGGKLWKNTGDI
jgi:hypothetical protein